ncbi:MAG: AbrB/MazE/SpoVT family DNA-binding domain-containing protein [Actinomycetota bacterium]|nr:AbrB/MazE/SpoVT family DNA-binding domain-containing protein [Actinomycetota bacterium]
MHEQIFLGTATVGERGQVAIPADARRASGIGPGDKLLFFAGPHSAGLFMVKAEELGRLVKHLTEKAQSIEQLISRIENL